MGLEKLSIRVVERRRTRRAVLGVTWFVLLAVGGTDAYLLTQRAVTTKVTFEDALTSFRRNKQAAATAEGPAGTDAQSPTTGAAGNAAAPPAGTPGSTTAPAANGAPTTVAPSAAAKVAPKATGPARGATTTTVPVSRGPAIGTAPTAYVLPPEGVYAYRTSGGESISVASANHQYPERTFTTVRHMGDCRWQAKSDVIKEHTDIRNLCSQPGSFTQLSQSREIEFYGAKDGAEQVCEPPSLQHAVGETPGTISNSVCKDDTSTSKFERTYVGLEQVTVGGVNIEVAHIKIRSVLSGRTEGTAFDELWFLPTNGLTVRWDRTVNTLADAAFGAKVRYEEQASFLLESLTPAT